MGIEYKKEFFDREYTVRESYGRLWKYARKYRLRIFVGIVSGICTAGVMVPMYQVVGPVLGAVGGATPIATQAAAEAREGGAPAALPPGGQPAASSKPDGTKLPSWYTAAEKYAERFGVKLKNEDDSLAGAALFLIIVVVPFLAALRLLFTFLNRYCLTWAGVRVVADIRCDMLRHLQSQSMQFFGRIDVGQIMSRIANDPGQIQTIIQTVMAELAEAPFAILAALGFIVMFAAENDMLVSLALIAIGLPMFMVPVIMLGKAIRRWMKRSLERNSVIVSKIHEILTCIKVVKSYDTEEAENRKYEDVNRNFMKSSLRAIRLGLLVGPAIESVGIVLLCAFVTWCFFTHTTMALIVPMLAPLLNIYKPIKQLAKIQVQVENAMAAVSRIYSILDTHMEIPEKPDARPKPSFDDRIVFDDVCFRYDGADRDAVRGASFEIPRGKVGAVVGGTGPGKSTLSNLLARFYDPARGRVTMDGVDLRDLRIHDLRKLVGSVMQETLLFNDTVEENIRYGTPGATREQVVAAAKMANAHDFIMAQPGGYDRLVGEKGFALSGGERQRIAIARAILKNPPILILDEATSALDTVTERLVQDAINNLMKDRTTFAIAHRLSTIRDADLILVMQDGEIVERGTHSELYDAGGVYRRLCDMQHQS